MKNIQNNVSLFKYI